MNLSLRRGLGLFLLLALAAGPAGAQDAAEALHRAGAACVLPTAPPEGLLSIPPNRRSQEYLDLGGLTGQVTTTSDISVNYLTSGTVFGIACSPWPASAQAAFEYAATLWEALLDSAPTIEVNACWGSLPSGVLGAAAAAQLTANFSGSVPNTWYQQALANAIAGTDLNGATVEIQAVLNANFGTWYTGTDASPPGGQTDLVTVALHELGHGLGFSGRAAIDDGTAGNGTECDGTAGNGCVGTMLPLRPYIYDRFTEDGAAGTALLSYTNPSAALGSALQGGASGVFFDGTAAVGRRLYAPGSFQPGSSYSHFDLGTFPAEVMKPALPPGQAIHDPGQALDVFSDLGWPLKPPVEMTSLSATADGAAVVLQWATASETNNAGFEVQVRAPGAEAFAAAGFVEGHGTTTEARTYAFRLDAPAPGTYAFRLKQIDFDGQSETFGPLEATVEMPEAFVLAPPYPNPFNPEATVTFAVAEAQPVRLELFDVLGQRAALLYDGTPEAGQTQRVRLDGRNLASGTYLVRLSGAGLVATQRVTLLK